MALVVLLRGVNVGGHRTFRPSVLAKELSDYNVVNIGAAGTFVVPKAVSRDKLSTELRRRLPFDAEIIMCEGRDLLNIVSGDPFAGEPSAPDIVRFVSVLAKPQKMPPAVPIIFPTEGEWLLRVVAIEGRFVFGVYRRHMRAIGYLSQIEKIFRVPTTTRNWNTIHAIAKILKN